MGHRPLRHRSWPLRAIGAALLLAAASGCDAPVPGDELADDTAADSWFLQPLATDGSTSAVVGDGYLWDDYDLDLSDLVELGSDWATSGLNSALAISDYAHLSLRPVEIYRADELDRLATGLAARFGERDLSTVVNQLRARHLRQSRDSVYAEAAFALGPRFAPNFQRAVPGFAPGTSFRIGFDAGARLEARVIVPYPSAVEAFYRAPLAAITRQRGFLFPEKFDDVLALAPGEVIALRGRGFVGANLGVGTPVLIANPTSYLSYQVVVAAGLRAVLEGDVDIQLIRLGGRDVVVDVGVGRARPLSARIALRDGWGVEGLIESHVELGGIRVDLGRLLERALSRQLTRRLNLVDGLIERTRRPYRQSVARLRFRFGERPDEAQKMALAQALRGDIRLAQGLAAMPESGVTAEFDLLRTGVTSTSYAGIELFGLNFFSHRIRGNGEAVVQTPAGVTALTFDHLEHRTGWFTARRSFARAGIAALPPGRGPAEANLLVQIEEADSALKRAPLLDHVDGVLLATAGQQATNHLFGGGNAIQHYVQRTCRGVDAFSPCLAATFRSEPVAAARDRSYTAFDAALPGSATASQRSMAAALGWLRLQAQSMYEFGAARTGPGTSILADYRLDADAVFALTDTEAPDRFRNAAIRYISATRHRDNPAGALSATELTRIGHLVAVYSHYAKLYRQTAARGEAPVVAKLATDRALTVYYRVDARNAPDYASAIAEPHYALRAQLLAALVDELVRGATGFGISPEKVVAYSLLATVPQTDTTTRIAIDFDLRDTLLHWREPFRAVGYPEAIRQLGAGLDARPVEARPFTVKALVRTQ